MIVDNYCSCDPLQTFEQALESSEKLREVASRSELLQLHGLYKQAQYGDNAMARPAMADIIGLARWQHWRDLEGMREEEAKQKYSALVNTCLTKYRDLIK